MTGAVLIAGILGTLAGLTAWLAHRVAVARAALQDVANAALATTHQAAEAAAALTAVAARARHVRSRIEEAE